MTIYDQYIYSLVLYIINNKHIFNFNKDLHLPAINMSKFSKGAYIAGIKF
jgi:hypothetical protein